MPAVIVTFVQATFVLATFVHITNVSVVTDQILTKLGNLNFWNHNFFGTDFFIQILFDPNQKLSEPKNAKKRIIYPDLGDRSHIKLGEINLDPSTSRGGN